jgi:hypothetical protein
VDQALYYIEERLGKMNYKALLEQDIEPGSGAVDGAVREYHWRSFRP